MREDCQNMIFFLLGKLRNLYMKIINSVVVAGLYYGFFTTFSIGSSYFLLIRAIATEKEKGREGTVKRVAATTGFIMGQLIMLLSIYSKPLYLLLGRPHTITALTLPYLFVHLFLSNHYKFDSYNSLQSFSTQLVFLNNLIFPLFPFHVNNFIFPLFYHFMLPSSMLARSANIYMFRCNNKILFVISSFVSWLIGLSLFIKYVDMLFVRIRQNRSIRSIIIRSNKYQHVLLSRFRPNKYEVSDLKYEVSELLYEVLELRDSMDRTFSILLFITCLCLLFRQNAVTHFKSENERNLKNERGESEKERSVKIETTFETKGTKQEQDRFTKVQKSAKVYASNLFTIILFIICIYSLGRAPSAFFTRKMIVETPRKGRRETIVETRGTKLEQDIFTEEGSDHFHHRWHPLFLLFNYKRWARPLRYIKNKKFENPVRNEMSQHFFFSGQENGHLRVSFTYPSHLANFMEMLEHKMYLSFFSKDNFVCDELDKFVCDELHHFDYWIHTNEKKLCSLRNEFTDRIEALDIGSPHLDVLEKKIRLCNNKTKKEYLPKIYDPFLNGSYRGIINQSFLPSIRNKQNKVYRILLFQEKTTGIKKIRKEVPRWPYQLASDVERARKKARKPIRQGKATLTGFHMRGRPKKRITFTKRKVDRPEDKQKGTRMGEFAKEVFDFSSSTTKNNDKNKNKKEIGALFYPRISPKKEYLPKIYDPFLNGSYRGIINQSFLPSIRNKQNKVYRILLFQEKTTGIKKIRKEVPRWPYQLASDVERARKKARKPIRQGKATLTGFHMRGRPKKRITFTKRKVDRPEDKQKGTRMGEFAKEVFDFSSSTTKNNDKNKNKKEIGALFYPRISDFRRNIITGSMRFQRRKTVVGRRLQVRAHSPLFFDVIVFYMQPLFDKVISRVIEISDRIQDIFFKITGIQLKNKRRSQRAEELEFYKSLGEELEKIDLKYKLEWEEELKKKRDLEDEIIEEDPRRAEEKERDRVLEIYDNVLFWEDPSIARTRLLLVQSKIRKWILLPSLILAKNIVRLLLLQKPEWAKDIRDMKREVHVLCNDNDMPIQRDDIFSKAWENEDRQLHIIIKNPFRLKPWHRSKRQPSGRDPMKKKNEKRKRFSYLTASGMETHRHYGAPNQLLSTAFSYFFAPIKKKSKKAIRKWSFLVLKMFKKRTKFLKVLKVLQELQKRIQSFIEKKKNSIINNQIFHKSSIQIRSMDRTNYSPTEKAEKEKKEKKAEREKKMKELTEKAEKEKKEKKAEREKKMKELTDKISTIRNEIKRITKDKKRTRKKNKRRNARLIRKPYLFIKWIGESIYTDIFWGIIPYTIKKIYRSIIKSLSRWMRIIKRFLKLTKKKKKKNTFEHISTIQKKLSLSHITHKMKIRKRRKRRARARVFFNLSLVSQNYVFYKLSQNQAINLYKLRSGLQYDGASLFLKNEIKDSFRRQGIISSELKHKNFFERQGIISSELKHKKLQNSGMNRWKNLLKKNQWIKWLKSHYQYELSERKWSKLGPQEWRSEVNQHCRVENRNLRKRKQNSSKREKKVSLLENQNYHLQKTYRYEKRSYQSIYYQDKKDSDSYGSALQIHKPNLVDMGGSSPIQNYIRKDHFMKNTDRKYFDMKGLDLFDLKIHKEIKPPNQKRNLFDWMGMNEEIRNLPYSIPWFFPQIGFKKTKDLKRDRCLDKFSSKKYFDMKGLDLFDLKIHKEIKPPNQKRNLFDWMGMNEEIRNLPYSIPWFFPQIGFKKNEGFKKRPVFRQIHSLLTIGEEDYTKSEMQIARKTEEEDVYSPIDIDNFIRSGRKNLKKIHLSFQLDWGNTIGSFELWEKMDEFKPDRVPSFERLLSLDCGKNNQIARRGDMLFKLKKNAVDPNTLNNMMLWLSHCDGVKGLENGMWSLEPGRVSVKDVKDNVKLIMYQTIKISLIHAIQQKNKRDRENMDKNLFKVSIGLIMPKNRKKKNYDLLVPENILSSRRRRELRILSCLNARNSNGVDKNAVFCNGNRVKTCGQFLDKSQDLDRDKKNFMKFKFFFFLWPNYRLEDLACMNRYICLIHD
nr:hypothetical chloroplast RF1 [Limonium bicolor]